MGIKKIFVTGGAGYIGAHVVSSLLENGYKVVVYDNLSTGRREHLPKSVKLIVDSVLDKDALNKAVKSTKPDAVIHLAALKAAGESMTEKAGDYSETNISGTINVLNVMIKYDIKHFVFSSTAATYGIPQYLPLDENHIQEPINYYGATKLIVENILRWYAQIYDFNYCALRYFNAAGHMPNSKITVIEPNPQNLIPIVLEVAAGKRDVLQIFGNDYATNDGTCVRDYIHVCDLASAHTLSLQYLESDKESLELNLATGRGYSVLDIYKKACKITNKEIKMEYAARRDGDMAELYAKSILAYKKLKWKAQYTKIDDMIQHAWDSYLKQTKLEKKTTKQKK